MKRKEVYPLNIIIPAFEPDQRMLTLINDIQSNSDYNIIIINDGSNPSFNSIFDKAKEAGCFILSHKTNKGKGAALKTAFRYLLEANETKGFVCADCDGQHTWSDIQKVATAISTQPVSIILGCREFIGKVPFKSRFGNKFTRFIFASLTGNKITDTQTGLRGFDASLLPWLVQIEGNRYEYEMNQLLQAKKDKLPLFCVPINTIYENKNAGSHFHPIRDSIRVYLPIVKFSLSSIVCGALDFILLFLLKRITDNLLFAVIGARLVSSVTNYILNRNLVFEDKKGSKSLSFVQYYLLVGLILSLNYLLLSFLNERLSVPLFISKIVTEGVLFGLSYFVQHKIIFHKKEK